MKNTIALDEASRERTKKLQQAQCFMEGSEFLKAETCYMDVIDEFPCDADAWFGLLGAYTWEFSKPCYEYKTAYDCEILDRFVYNMTLYNKNEGARLGKAFVYTDELRKIIQEELDYRVMADNESVRGTEPGPKAMTFDQLADLEYYCDVAIEHIENART